MGEVHEDAEAVHLTDDVGTEVCDAHLLLTLTRTCGTADVVVTVVAERHIDDAVLLQETLQQMDVATDGIAVLDAEHDGLAPLSLQAMEILDIIGHAHGCRIRLDHLLHAGELAVGIGGGSGAPLISERSLGDVGHHGAGIQTSLTHLMQVHEYLGVAPVEVDVLIEEHRRVAMAVEGDDAAVYAARLAVVGSLVGQPAEERHHARIATQTKAFGVPLHADDALMLGGFHGFDDAVGCCGADAQVGACLAHSLVMEAVDRQRLNTHNVL